MNTIFRTNFSIYRNISNVRYFCSSQVPKNVIENLITADQQAENGVIYDKKPFKVNLVEKKNFSWCLCGRSKSQPFCDGKALSKIF